MGMHGRKHSEETKRKIAEGNKRYFSKPANRKRRREMVRRIFTKHGLAGTPIYFAWNNIKARTSNPNWAQFKDYGGRGIKCEWESFDEFVRDMGPTYKKGLSIDRIDVDGNYSRSNCKWATRHEQANNQRRTIRFRNETANEAAKRLGGNKALIVKRVNVYKWSLKRAFSTPVQIHKLTK